MSDLITPDLIDLDLTATDRHEATRKLLVSAIVVVVAKSFKPGESDEQIAAEIEAGAAAELPAPRTATPARTG